MEQPIKDKWVLVTGSSRGVGRQIALGLAEQGCHVILHGRELGHVQETLGLLPDDGATGCFFAAQAPETWEGRPF